MIKKLLIADDSPVARKILKSCIPKDRGYEFYEVGDGLAALQKYEEVRPDLTFMDLTMPVMDGVEALMKILELDRNAVVVVSTADVQKKTIQKVMELGAYTLLKKPPSKESVQEVLLRVEEHLENQKRAHG